MSAPAPFTTTPPTVWPAFPASFIFHFSDLPYGAPCQEIHLTYLAPLFRVMPFFYMKKSSERGAKQLFNTIYDN